MDLEYNTIYEMIIKNYRYRAIKSMNGIIYTLVSTNYRRTGVIMSHLQEDLSKAALYDKVIFKLDGKVVCEKTVDEVFNSGSDPITGLNVIAEETLWINRANKDEVEAIKETLKEQMKNPK